MPIISVTFMIPSDINTRQLHSVSETFKSISHTSYCYNYHDAQYNSVLQI